MHNSATNTQSENQKVPIHRRLYDWVLGWAHTPYGLPALIVISFMESSFFPIPPDVLLIALVLGMPSRWYVFAGYCTVASVLGGILGYAIGSFAWDTIGQWIVTELIHVQLVLVDGRLDIELPKYLVQTMGDALGGQYLFQVYDYWNAWIAFVFGLTPLPYKLVTITAGVAQVNLGIFVAASIAARGLRFFLVAYLLKLMGERAKQLIEKHFNTLTVIFIGLLIAGFAIIKIIL